MKEIGQRMRARREYLGLTQSDLAAAMGVGGATYSRYESGRLAISAPDLPRAAKALRVSAGYLYGEDGGESEEIQYEPILDALHVASYSGGLDDDDMGEVADIILIKARRRAERQGRA